MPPFSRLRNSFFVCAVWLDSLRADLAFGWKQVLKRKSTSVAAIVSLGLGIGSCTAAFQLIDALLLRPLPVSGADRLNLLAREGFGPGGDLRISESCEYPLFQSMRAAAAGQADLIAVSYAERVDVTYASGEEMEKAHRQYVSGSMWSSFGLRPSIGRLFAESDDRVLGSHPFAVLSHDYWSRRFGRDPGVVGHRMRIGADLLEIVGVGPEGFTGTEPGTVIDVFIPAMMNPLAVRSDASWFRVLALLKPGVAPEPLRAKLHAMTRFFNEQRASAWTAQTRTFLDRFLNQKVLLEPAPTGASGMQRNYRVSLAVLGVLVALVLLIACLNVANLMTVQAAARAREMALRISIGAGRRRLTQLVFAESAWLGGLASILGGLFAWWAAPFVVSRINPLDNPARLSLPLDWRVTAFAVALTFAITFILGLIPALRTKDINPASALKGGDNPHARRRLMLALVAVQVAFCFVVHFAAGLFVTTFDRLANQAAGFRSEGLVVLDVAARQPQSLSAWAEIAGSLGRVPGVEGAAMAGWPLLSGNGWNGFIWTNGAPTEVLSYFLSVSPGWIEVMGMRLADGRDLRLNDAYPGAALVNEAFVRQCFGGRNPVGQWFEKETGNGVTRDRFEIVGVVNDARYRNMREPVTPTAYVPLPPQRSSGALIVRTSMAAPMALAPVLRKEVAKARPEFRVSNVRLQRELNEQHTLRERLLAMLAAFFAAMALLLAGIGLYGVLENSVWQRRRELGIRIAVGAKPVEIARLVTADVAVMVILGTVAGLGLGLLSTRYVVKLLYQVKPTEAAMLVLPALVILGAAVLAMLPAVLRSVRIHPAAMLRAE